MSSSRIDEDPLAGSVTDVFRDAAADAADATFLTSRSLPGEQYTYGSFFDEAAAIARHLVAAGVSPRDRVAILAENRPRWCVAYLAILLAGGVVVPVDVHLPLGALTNVLRDAAITAMFLSDAQRQRIGDALTDVLRLSLEDDGAPDVRGYRELTATSDASLPAPLRDADPLAIIYTSGTTGDPKGVTLSHRNVRAEMVGILRALKLSGADVLMMFLPLNHVLSQLGGFVLAAPFRVRVVHAEIKHGEELLRVVREEGVTVLLAVPLLYHLIHERMRAAIDTRPLPARKVAAALMRLNAALRRAFGLNLGPRLFRAAHAPFGSRLRLLYSGGAMLDPAVQRDFHALGFTLGQAYGLTETTGCATMTPADDITIGSVGRPLHGVEVRVSEPDADGVGEVQLRGAIITAGYFGREEASRELFDDGWLRTGDLGRLDARGDLFLTGRIKDVIVLGNGKNIYPEEIEHHYSQSPLIQEMCVISQRRVDGADRTEKLHAVVVPDFESCRRLGIQSVRVAIHDALQKLSQSLPSWQRVLSFDISREPLPRTATRKLQRFKVIEQLAESQAGATVEAHDEEGAALPGGEISERVAELIRKRAGEAAKVRADSSLELDLGLDSLNRMELLLAVEQAFGVHIDDEEAAGILTAGDLIAAVERRGELKTPSSATDSPWTAVIAAASNEHIPAWLNQGRGLAADAFFGVVTALSRFLGRFVFRLRFLGAEHLPDHGPFLICPNHASFLDGPLVIAHLPRAVRRRAFAVGAPVHVSGGFRTWFSRALSILPIDSDRHIRESLQTSAALLKSGRVLIIFPEGSRTFDGRLQGLRDGAAVLATELGLPIVPCAILGTFEAWPRQRRLPRAGRVTVRFGPALEATTQAASAADLTDRLRRALIDLGVDG